MARSSTKWGRLYRGQEAVDIAAAVRFLCSPGGELYQRAEHPRKWRDVPGLITLGVLLRCELYSGPAARMREHSANT
jgi:hypothetical protein